MATEAERIAELERQLAERVAEIAALKEQLANRPAAGKIQCPACDSEITSDGATLVKKSDDLAAQEALADSAEELKRSNETLLAENSQLKGQRPPADPPASSGKRFRVISGR